MKVFAIGDLHLSGNPPTKPMDIFGPHWNDHWARIKEHWNTNVSDEDIVFLVGDMSWALRLEEAAYDLQEIASLPGKKYIGGHRRTRCIISWATLLPLYKVTAPQNSSKPKKVRALLHSEERVPTSVLETPTSLRKRTNPFTIEN